jgi:hypothetical protein
VAPDYSKCVAAPPGSWAPGGPVSEADTRIRKCPSNKPVTIAEATCSPKHCKPLTGQLILPFVYAWALCRRVLGMG